MLCADHDVKPPDVTFLLGVVTDEIAGPGRMITGEGLRGYDIYSSAHAGLMPRWLTILRTWKTCTMGRRAPRLPVGSDR